jgi:hypothetical protein
MHLVYNMQPPGKTYQPRFQYPVSVRYFLLLKNQPPSLLHSAVSNAGVQGPEWITDKAD